MSKVFIFFKYQVSYLAKFVEYYNTEKVFTSWIKSNMMYNYDSQNIHNQVLQCVDDEQLGGSGIVFD